MIKPTKETEELSEGSEKLVLEELQTRMGFIEETLRERARQKKGFPGLPDNRMMANLSVVTAAVLGALVLGSGIFLLIRGVQWRGALSELRAEPGIQVMSVRSLGPLKKQVFGLRDPLAPNPHKILQKHNIAPNRVDFQLVEYHSLNTPYGRQREEQQAKELQELRGKLIGVVGTLSEENRMQREEELGKISQLLLEIRFPEAMQKLNLQYDEGVWHADGKLLANEYEEFKARAPQYILNGTVDLDKIGNFTQEKSAALIAGIQAPNLLDKDYSGEPAHVQRLGRLIREYDALCVKSGTPQGRLRLIVQSNTPDKIEAEVNTVADKLTDAAQLAETRIRIIPPIPVTGKEVEDRLSLEISE